MEQIDQLATLVAELNDREGSSATTITGLYLTKLSTTTVPRNTVEEPVFCIVAQGTKNAFLYDEQYMYDRGTYLVVSLDLPVVGQIIEASAAKPFLGISMSLDFAEISSLIVEAGLAPLSDAKPQRGMAVYRLDDDVLDAVLRLTRLLKTPDRVPILAPLIRREIFYTLLLSDKHGMLRRMAAENSHMQRIATGVGWLRKNATRPIRMDELAREVHMSTSTMHTWFKAVTNMSPLQFQKQLRLLEARRMLLADSTDAATVSYQVGYESPSQFSREYRRLFGLPPVQDVERIRKAMLGGLFQSEGA